MLGEPGVALRFRGVKAGGRINKLATKELEGGLSSLPPRRHFVQFQSLTSPVEQSQVDKDDSLENHRKKNVEFVWRLNALSRAGQKVL